MIKSFSVLTIAACVACSGASAATFDFEADADAFWDAVVILPGPSKQKKYEGTFDQVYGISTIDGNARATAAGTVGGNTDGGITVTASATDAAGTADPFMDSNDAGLGVCSGGFHGSGVSDCSSGHGGNTGDDNLVTPELLTLGFNFDVFLTGLQIRDADHDLISNQTDAISINGGLYDTGANGQVILTGLGGASSFLFTSNGSTPGDEIYLSVLEVNKVPVPASLPLLAGGLGIAGWFARRRKKS